MVGRVAKSGTPLSDPTLTPSLEFVVLSETMNVSVHASNVHMDFNRTKDRHIHVSSVPQHQRLALDHMQIHRTSQIRLIIYRTNSSAMPINFHIRPRRPGLFHLPARIPGSAFFFQMKDNVRRKGWLHWRVIPKEIGYWDTASQLVRTILAVSGSGPIINNSLHQRELGISLRSRLPSERFRFLNRCLN